MITYQIVPERNYAYIEVLGTTSLDEYISATLDFISDPECNPGLDRICDFSRADLSLITFSEIKKFAAFAKEYVVIDRFAKIALVAPDPRKMSMFLVLLGKFSSGRFRIVADLEEAQSWVFGEWHHVYSAHLSESPRKK